jgi:predicted transposase YbfD/YdcC
MNIQKLKMEIKSLKDPRRTSFGNIRHSLESILVIALLSIICGGEDFKDMETFGKERKDFLKKFIDLPNGIPDSDTFRRVFERLDPSEVFRCLNAWLELERSKNETINIDGKTICGSKNKEHKAFHVVSAWVADNQITLGQIKTEEKSNEITAIPKLLDLVDINGSTVTIDAMGCQKNIAKKIRSKCADYVLALKSNHETLFKNVKLYFKEQVSVKKPHFKTENKSHGRVETREYFLATDINWLHKKNEWEGLKAVGAVVSKVERGEKTTTQTRYFLTSLTEVKDFAKSVRKHWSIENQLHWVLDISFREDSCGAKKDNSPLNLNILRKIAMPLLKRADFGRMGIRKKMFKAALNPNRLLEIIFKK